MISEQSTVFPKQIKFDDYEPVSQQNLIRVMETSNLLLGSGGRSSATSIIMAKCLHILQEELIINFQGKNLLQFGSGVGLLGIYLGWMGANVVLTDLPELKDTIERNINLNKQMLKGNVTFLTLNWKDKQLIKNVNGKGASLLGNIDIIDWTLACQCGGLEDLELQLKWIGKQGMIIGFMERDYPLMDDSLTSRQLEEYLLGQQYEYERIQNYHPDYIDQRVCIYKIWRYT